MDERGRLQRRLVALIGERAVRDPAQLLVEQREQPVGGGAIATPPGAEEARDLARRSGTPAAPAAPDVRDMRAQS